MHHPILVSGEASRHPYRWPCRLSCIGLRTCTALLMLLGLTVIFPLFYTDKIRHINLDLRQPIVFQGAPLDVHVPIFKKQPRDRMNKSSRKYTLEPNVCSGDPSSHPFLVLFVPSRPGYAEERAAVRETWGVHARQCNVRVVFGFGTFESDNLFYEASTENSIYGDLLQTSTVIDAYHNQTRLVLSFLEWGADHCQGAKFIGKADEDTWINIFGVLKYLQLPEARENAAIGHFLYSEKVKRLTEEKWYLTLAEYANDTYPPFAVGQLYIFPQTSLPSVLSAAKRITIHWLDDVFIGGQIPDLLKMTLVHIQERSHLWEVDGVPCFGAKYFIIHATPAAKKREIYYDRCMELYRQGACQAQLDVQDTVRLGESEPILIAATAAPNVVSVTESARHFSTIVFTGMTSDQRMKKKLKTLSNGFSLLSGAGGGRDKSARERDSRL